MRESHQELFVVHWKSKGRFLRGEVETEREKHTHTHNPQSVNSSIQNPKSPNTKAHTQNRDTKTSTTESPKVRTQNTKPNIKHRTYTNPQRKNPYLIRMKLHCFTPEPTQTPRRTTTTTTRWKPLGIYL